MLELNLKRKSVKGWFRRALSKNPLFFQQELWHATRLRCHYLANSNAIWSMSCRKGSIRPSTSRVACPLTHRLPFNTVGASHTAWCRVPTMGDLAYAGHICIAIEKSVASPRLWVTQSPIAHRTNQAELGKAKYENVVTVHFNWSFYRTSASLIQRLFWAVSQKENWRILGKDVTEYHKSKSSRKDNYMAMRHVQDAWYKCVHICL